MKFDKQTYLSLFDKYAGKQITADEKLLLLRYVQNDEHLQSWMKQQIENMDSSMLDDDTRRQMFTQIRSKIEKPSVRKISWQRRFLRIAAMILLPLFAALAMYWYMVDNTGNSGEVLVKVERGQKATITLPDGTKAFLNSETTLSYSPDYNKKQRNVNLTGEAYFEVTKNPKCPFVVMAEDVSIQALGTAFNVKAYPDMSYITTTLTEGKINFKTPRQQLVLIPNQIARFNKKTGKAEKEDLFNASKQIDWLNNNLTFDRSTLGEVSEMLGRIYNIDIVFANESMRNYQFTGTFPNNSIESVLKTISLSAPIRYTIKDGSVLLEEVEREKKFFKKQ